MSNPVPISPLHIVPQASPAPVMPLLTPEEKTFLDFLAGVIVKDLINQVEKKKAG